MSLINCLQSRRFTQVQNQEVHVCCVACLIKFTNQYRISSVAESNKKISFGFEQRKEPLDLQCTIQTNWFYLSNVLEIKYLEIELLAECLIQPRITSLMM